MWSRKEMLAYQKNYYRQQKKDSPELSFARMSYRKRIKENQKIIEAHVKTIFVGGYDLDTERNGYIKDQGGLVYYNEGEIL